MKKRVYVNHPLYGDKPAISGYDYPLDEVVSGYWGYKAHNIFPKSAILADEGK